MWCWSPLLPVVLAEPHPPVMIEVAQETLPFGLRDPFPVCFQPSNRVSIRTRAAAAHQCPSGSGGLRFDALAGGGGEASLVPWLGLHVLHPRCHWLSWHLCGWIDASPASLPQHSLPASPLRWLTEAVFGSRTVATASPSPARLSPCMVPTNPVCPLPLALCAVSEVCGSHD